MRKLAIFSAGFAIAAAAYVYLLGDARALLLAGACLLLSLLCKRFGIKRFAIGFLGIAAAFLWCTGYQLAFDRNAPPVSEEEQMVVLRVTDLPQDSKYGATVPVELDGYEAILYSDDEALKLQPGDAVTCSARVDRAINSPEDGESLFFRSRGARFLIFSKSTLTVESGNPEWPERIRMWLRDRILSMYEGNEAGFLLAILTGDRSGLDFSVQMDLSVAGLSHAIAVSGMHVSMLLAMISVLCGKNPRLTAMIGIPVVITFALMTGATASVCRAAFMHVCMLSAPLLGRETDSLTTLSGASLFLLLLDPWSVADVSFQLSFAAVAGLMVFSGPIQKKILSLQKQPGRLLRTLASGVSATVSATLATLPLIVIYFGAVSLVSVPVNLLCLWAVTVVFTAGLLGCFLGGFGNILAWPVALLVRYILTLCDWVSKLPYAAAYSSGPALLIWACAAYLLVGVLLLSKRKLPVWWCMSGLTAAFLVCVLLGRWNLCREPMTFTAVDVGQGQSLILQSGDFTAVIDCGGSYPAEAGEYMARQLHSAGITQVDVLILTHYDEDHSGGAGQLMDRVEVSQILMPAYESDHRTALETAAEQACVPAETVGSEALVEFQNGWIRVMAARPGQEGNDAGLCVLANAAGYDILVTGDRSGEGELELLTGWEIPDVDLLVAGHHGAADSTTQLLLEQTKPETVIISVEADNAYGHPAEVILQRIEAAGAEILRTDLLGTITVTD